MKILIDAYVCKKELTTLLEIKKETITRIITEKRSFNSFEEFDAKHGKREGTWLSKGTNHKITKNFIEREVEEVVEREYIEVDHKDLTLVIDLIKHTPHSRNILIGITTTTTTFTSYTTETLLTLYVGDITTF